MPSIKEIEEVYDERYQSGDERLNKREYDLYRKYRALLLPKVLHKPSTNLDLGCGRGHKTLGFVESFDRVLAIDLSSNVISHCKELHHSENIEFVSGNALEISERFNIITAFGFSLFNTKEQARFMEVYDHFATQNLPEEGSSYIIIGSFTDFSGGGIDSWYLHTKEEIDDLTADIKSKYGAKVSVIFPHKKWKNYFGWGFYNFVAELGKLILKRKKTFFIVAEHG